ncbi:MAG: HD domain-containing phosphohydrolase [Thermoanaerobaculia bacterium]|jgi:putative nucleotidyltransferase with HDIG domain
MLPELSEVEPKLKEILYNCLEQIRATKAALYIADSERQPFELVTQYGFKDGLRKQIELSDPAIDLLLLKRVPFFLNSLGEDSRFAQTLDSASTTRMLIAPIYSRGRLYGFVDMRDKAAGKPFEHGDSEAGQAITQQFIELFAERGVFGLSAESLVPVATSSGNIEVPKVASTPELSVSYLKISNRTIDDAKRYVDRGGLRPRAGRKALTDAHVRGSAVVLPGVLAIPGALVAALSAFSELGGSQVVASRAPVMPEAMDQFQAKLRGWQQKRNEPDKLTETSIQYPYGKLGSPIGPERMVSTLSAPVRVEGISGVVLTVAFESQAGNETKAILEEFLARLEQIVRYAMVSDDYQSLRQRIAQKLIEPDLNHYPHLKNHSERVADLAERLSLFVGLEPAEVETIRVAAYVHDVGMRLLDYGAIYRKSGLTTEDMELIKNHPVVGAAVIAESPLGAEIANIVLSHHERPDGGGYPAGLDGEQIPIGSRIIHICEAFDAMTASDSYQTPVPAAAALAKIKRVAGVQFDAALAEKFAEMMSRE